MTIRVRLFARARDLAGADLVCLELPEGAAVADLRTRIAEACPALTPLLASSAIAVNEDFATEETLIPPAADVAFLPPVSGGS
jgi:sulfur-carrier protein